jgi:type IV pilus assembly protein PilP
MKKIKLILLSAFIIVFIMAFFACTDEVKNASKSKAAAKKITPVAATSVPSQNQAKPVPVATTVPIQNKTQPASNATVAPNAIDNYSYNPSGKPDPFRPFIVIVDVAAKEKVAKKAAVSMFPLQRAETERYRVVGIAGDKDRRVAIAEDAAKKFYPLFIGTHIGLYNGKVIEIMADRVIVEEYETKKAKRVILKLRKN